MKELLSDPTQFQPIDKDPTTSCESKLNNHLKTIQDKHSINKKQRLHLQSTTAIPPRVFGQYKIHKERPDGNGHPLRLVTSTVKTVAYNASKELTSILSKAYQNPKFTIKNSRQAFNALRNKRILRGHRMASFDMENCFGSISTALAIKLIKNDFDEKVRPHTTMEKEDFIELLRICLDECNYLLYKGQFYRQINGIFMGNSLGSIIVQIVTEHIISQVIEQLKKDKLIPPSVWIVYVDDHLVICREPVINEILKKLNAFDPGRIKFTCELETNSSINFLDLTIRRQDGSVITNWYSKSIASNRMLNYYSAHQKKTVSNVAISFAKKVFEYSHPTYHQENTIKIKDILTKNNFPQSEIQRIIQLAKRKPNTVKKPADNTTPKFASVVYVPGMSESLKKQIKYFIPEVKIADRPTQKLATFYSKEKDKIDKTESSGVVYQFTCPDCNCIYIGETCQKLCTRRQQHKNSISTTNLARTKVSSALALHTKTTGHQFDFERIKILDRNSNKRKLQISEVNHIIMNQERACNYKKDSERIAPAYTNLLRQFAGKNDQCNWTRVINHATPNN
ncbi:uncharacterized protein LOC119078966 [Bradysia coprophila]|nr:uncharacterized protein LOC119078966 [Bradysia coprophila]